MVLCSYSSTVTLIWRMPHPITPSIAGRHWSFPHWSFWNPSVAYVCNCPHVFHTVLGQWTTMTLQHSHLQFPKSTNKQTNMINHFDKKFKWVCALWGLRFWIVPLIWDIPNRPQEANQELSHHQEHWSLSLVQKEEIQSLWCFHPSELCVPLSL